MTEPDMTADVETEDFTDELSDEALDREEGRYCVPSTYSSPTGSVAAAPAAWGIQGA